jgi:hypothetical protein
MSLQNEQEIHDDKKLGESNFTTAVEPGHAIQYGEEPVVTGGLKRQLKSRHVSTLLLLPMQHGHLLIV